MRSDPAPGQLLAHLSVSRETIERLEVFAEILGKWNPRINLVSNATLASIWTRHMLDSAQIWAYRPEAPRLWADLGSGGGFPGLVIAAIASEQSPETRFVLVDSDTRKGVFLRTAAQAMDLDIEVITDRIDAVPPLSADVISARALAPLAELLDMSERHLRPGGTALFLKGASYQSELTEASKTWEYKAETIPSVTDRNAVIVKIKGFSRV